MMTLLELIQQYADRTGLERPSVVMASVDDTIIQLRALANEVVNDMLTRGHSWTELQKEATFTTVADELQGSLATIAPDGFQYIYPETIFNRTSRLNLCGPRSPQNWQLAEATAVHGPMYSFRIRGGNLYMQPAPTAGDIIAFEYASNYAILNGVTWKRRFTADEDVFQLDEELLLAGLKAKWRRVKGLSYAQEMQDYEYLLTQAMGNNNDKGPLSLSGGQRSLQPAVFVPSGSWNI